MHTHYTMTNHKHKFNHVTIIILSTMYISKLIFINKRNNIYTYFGIEQKIVGLMYMYTCNKNHKAII